MRKIDLSRSRLVLYLSASFLAGIAAAALAPWLVSRGADHVFPLQLKEIARVTSPDGAVDAVMIRDNCGAPCSFGYSVFIVPRGTRPPRNFAQVVFSADDMTDEKLVWKQPHLLDIAYSQALIHTFRNVSHPFGEFGAKEQNWHYRVEIQLAPSSSGFSYLREKDLQ